MIGELAELGSLATELGAAAHEAIAALYIARRRDEERPPERLHAHYLVERRLADRVRAAATPEERRKVFATMYDELFTLVPDHPRVAARAASTAARERDLRWSLAQVEPYLFDGCRFMEIGAGDCALSALVAARAQTVYAVDISRQAQGELPGNVEVVITDGSSIPVPAGSIDVAFSDQLMEHLHPDDARAQLANIHRALKPGGVYMCITPNRAYGPSDISAYFDEEARGFHLKEYTVRDIRDALREAGFARMHAYAGARGYFVRVPAFAVCALESLMLALPAKLRHRLGDMKALRAALGVRVAGIKGHD